MTTYRRTDTYGNTMIARETLLRVWRQTYELLRLDTSRFLRQVIFTGLLDYIYREISDLRALEDDENITKAWARDFLSRPS